MKKIVSIWMFFCCCTMLSAQEQRPPRFSPEDFKAKMQAFITKEAGLTPQEAGKFFPLFDEMNKKQRELNEQTFKLVREQGKSCTTDKQYAELIDKIDLLKLQNAKLEADYHKKMIKVVSAKKVFAAMRAERKFHRQMLKKMSDRRDGNRPQGMRPRGQNPAKRTN